MAEKAFVNFTLVQTITKTGFHRELVSEIDVVVDPDLLKCAVQDISWTLLQEVPAATYVDYDEVDELERLKIADTMALVRDKKVKPMETEGMAHLSRSRRLALEFPIESVQVDVVAKTYVLHVQVKGRVPIHARYQLPHDGTSLRIRVPPGTLCIRCQDEPCTFKRNFCRLNKDTGSCATILGPEWYTLHNSIHDNGMQFEIPVGDISETTLVSVVTKAAVLMGAASVSIVALRNRI